MPAVGAEIGSVAVRIFSYFPQRQWLVGAAQEGFGFSPFVSDWLSSQVPMSQLCEHVAPQLSPAWGLRASLGGFSWVTHPWGSFFFDLVLCCKTSC